jgi:uncharacterized membrane protein HdeD (DUF308 family)
MFNTHNAPHQKPHPLRTVLGVLGIVFGIMFFLQASEVIPFSFDMTTPVYLKIFAGYAILSGIVLIFNAQRHGIIRY